MKRLIRYFIDLCLLRALPQDLPATPFLLWLILPLNLMVSVALIGNSLGGTDRGLFAAFLNIVMLLLLLWSLLAFKRHPGRFLQAATAFLGSDALMGLAGLPLQLLVGDGNVLGSLAGLAVTLRLFVWLWSLMVEAHILRHTLEVGMGLALALALTYSVLIMAIIGSIFPESSS